METIGIIGVYRGYIGDNGEKKMETTIYILY